MAEGRDKMAISGRWTGRLALRLARLVLAAVTVAAMVIRALSPDTDLGNFFSYFTYQSIIIAVVGALLAVLINGVGRWRLTAARTES